MVLQFSRFDDQGIIISLPQHRLIQFYSDTSVATVRKKIDLSRKILCVKQSIQVSSIKLKFICQ